jgi:hypothetical protein
MFFYIGRLALLRLATVEFVFGLQPIVKLIALKAATFENISYARSLISSQFGAWFAEVFSE